LRIAAPTSYGNYNLYIAVRKDWPELVTIFNKVLNTIPPQQHTEIKNRWLTVRYEHGIGVGDILKYVLLVAGIAALILAVILVWNKRLQREIAERKQAETALQDSKERYTALFERSLDPVYIHDFEGNFIDANQVSLDLLGYSREETPSINLIAILGKDQVEPALETVKEIMETGSHKKIKEYRLKTKEGLDVWMETKASLIYKDGRPFAVQGVARDVTERKRVEQERENLIDDLQTALENIKTLKGLLPICASCKKIRDDKGYWNQIETYIEKHSDALFSHSICEECAEKLYGDQEWFKKANKESNKKTKRSRQSWGSKK
ncbi:MAG: PAS domain S-box protein, partial [Proteobacteria bacterium]|nr:PAS domain S-box protein [Pseudomonadota bacterium]